MAALRFQFFGPPRFTVDGEPVKIGRRKAVALAAFIAVSNKLHSRDLLAEMFWPDYDRDRARSSLRRTLAAMTKALGKFWLVIDRDSIGLAPNENLWVDVNRFRELTASSPNAPVNEAALKEAAALYGDNFLAGFTLGDSPDFDDWQFEQAENLGRAGAIVWERLSARLMRNSEYSPAIRYARDWVGADPLNEEAHRRLIRLYQLTDQRGNALRQYEKCKALLEKELGVEPDARTSALAVEIRTKPCITKQSTAPALTSLPAQTTRFIGRQQELQTLTAMICSPEVRLLTLTGPGGIGKTRLAIETATFIESSSRPASLFPQGVFYISLMDLSSMDAVVTALLNLFDLDFDERKQPLERLIEFLAPRKLCLVFDNLEHLSDVNMLASQMLSKAAGLKVIATSRTRLKLKGEHIFQLSGLSRPSPSLTGEDESDLSRIEDLYGAIGLFLDAARAVEPNIKITSRNINGILRICELTMGMPLALILAAGWIEIFQPEKIADEIEKNLDFLKADLYDLPSWRQSMRAVFDSSWMSLSKIEKEMFMRLSVFKDGFTMEAASSALGVERLFIAAVAADLVRKSLLNAYPETERFEFHPLLHQYAREKLDQAGLTKNMMDAHRDYYLDLVFKSEKRLIGEGMLQCRREMDDDFANIRQAWLWTVAQGDFKTLACAAPGLYVYFDMHTRYYEGEALFRPAKNLVIEAWKPGLDPEAGVILLCWFDMQAQGLSPKEQSHSGDREFREILTVSQGMLREGVKRRNGKSRAYILLLMGTIAHRQYLYTRAIRFFRLCLEQYPEIEYFFWVYIRIGRCWQAVGRMRLAIDNIRRSYDVGSRLGDEIKRAWSLTILGSTELCMGDMETARSRIRIAAASFEGMKAPIGMVFSLEELGWIAFLTGDLEQAVLLADQALSISMEHCFAISRYQRVLALKGFALVVMGKQDQGEICLEKVLRTGTGRFTAHLAMFFLQFMKGDRFASEYHLKSAYENVSSVYRPQMKELLTLATAAAAFQTGEEVRSCELLSRIFHSPNCPKKLFDAWEIPGFLLSRLEACLSPDTFKSAWELGRMA